MALSQHHVPNSSLFSPTNDDRKKGAVEIRYPSTPGGKAALTRDTTWYLNVSYRKRYGDLLLSPKTLAFYSDDGLEAMIIEWSNIQAIKANVVSSPKNLIKVTHHDSSSISSSRFQFESRSELEKAKDDMKDRREKAREATISPRSEEGNESRGRMSTGIDSGTTRVSRSSNDSSTSNTSSSSETSKENVDATNNSSKKKIGSRQTLGKKCRSDRVLIDRNRKHLGQQHNQNRRSSDTRLDYGRLPPQTLFVMPTSMDHTTSSSSTRREQSIFRTTSPQGEGGDISKSSSHHPAAVLRSSTTSTTTCSSSTSATPDSQDKETFVTLTPTASTTSTNLSSKAEQDNNNNRTTESKSTRAPPPSLKESPLTTAPSSQPSVSTDHLQHHHSITILEKNVKLTPISPDQVMVQCINSTTGQATAAGKHIVLDFSQFNSKDSTSRSHHQVLHQQGLQQLRGLPQQDPLMFALLPHHQHSTSNSYYPADVESSPAVIVVKEQDAIIAMNQQQQQQHDDHYYHIRISKPLCFIVTCVLVMGSLMATMLVLVTMLPKQ